MNLRTSRARAAGAVAALLVAGTTVGLALSAGNASADEPGRCTRNVNVRAEPDATSRVVATCRAGTKVDLGEERDGFVRIDDLGGWASHRFVTGTTQAADVDPGTADDPADPADPAVDVATRDGGATDAADTTTTATTTTTSDAPGGDLQVAGNRVTGPANLLG